MRAAHVYSRNEDELLTWLIIKTLSKNREWSAGCSSSSL